MSALIERGAQAGHELGCQSGVDAEGGFMPVLREPAQALGQVPQRGCHAADDGAEGEAECGAEDGGGEEEYCRKNCS